MWPHRSHATAMFVLHCSSAARQQCPSTATRNAFGGRSRTRRISLRRSATSLCGGTICLRMRRPERRYSPTHPRILVGQETTGAEREQRARTQLEVLCRGSHTPSLWGWGIVRCVPLSRACGRWIGRSVGQSAGWSTTRPRRDTGNRPYKRLSSWDPTTQAEKLPREDDAAVL